MKTVEFKFDIDEKVTTNFETSGIVEGLYYDDDGGAQCYVKTGSGGAYFKEKDLTSGWKENRD